MKKIEAHLRPDGRWEAKGIDPATGQRKSFYSKLSKGDAEKKAAASYGIEAEDRSLYAYYSTTYLPTIAHRSKNWQAQVGWAMDKYVIPALGHIDITEIKRAEAQRFFNSLLSSLKPSSAAKVKIVLSGVMNLAEDDEIIVKNPIRRVRLPVGEAPNKTALTFEELKALLDASHDAIKPFVLLCGFAGGLRAGEALGVTRGHIQGGTLSVRQQILQPKGGCIVTAQLKTPQTRREIPLPSGLAEAILSCKQVSGIYVCSDSKGGFLTPNNATREFEIAVKAAEIRRVTPHELRHTFISLLENELEAPPAIAAALAGKKHSGLTSDYSHTHRKQLERWMQKFWDTALAVDVEQFKKEG